MENFRSICILHKRKDNLTACYFKEFFKWIGFSYYKRDVGENSFLDLPDVQEQGFDIILKLNCEEECSDISEGEVVTFEKTDSAGSVFLKTIGNILDKYLKGKDKHIIKRLIVIYLRNHMCGLLYEYTMVILPKAGKACWETIYKKYLEVINKLEVLETKVEQKPTFGMEYLLYAKYFCQYKINELCEMQKLDREYDVKQYIKDVEKICEYDKDLFKVEELKGKSAKLCPNTNPEAKIYFEHCAKQCPIDVCKGYHYYTFGKWLQDNGQAFKAGEVFHLAYQHAPDYIKAVYKVAVDYKDKNNREMAMVYMRLIVKIWESVADEDKNMLTLFECEYAYKAYKVLAYMETRDVAEEYEKDAQKVTEFVESLKNNKDSLIHRLYEPLGINPNEMVDAVAKRVKPAVKTCMEE